MRVPVHAIRTSKNPLFMNLDIEEEDPETRCNEIGRRQERQHVRAPCISREAQPPLRPACSRSTVLAAVDRNFLSRPICAAPDRPDRRLLPRVDPHVDPRARFRCAHPWEGSTLYPGRNPGESSSCVYIPGFRFHFRWGSEVKMK